MVKIPELPTKATPATTDKIIIEDTETKQSTVAGVRGINDSTPSADTTYSSSKVDTLLAGKSDTGHTHDDRYYTESETDSFLAGKSDTGHTHAISDVTGLQTELDGKSDINHTQSVVLYGNADGTDDLSADGYFDFSNDTAGNATGVIEFDGTDATKINILADGLYKITVTAQIPTVLDNDEWIVYLRKNGSDLKWRRIDYNNDNTDTIEGFNTVIQWVGSLVDTDYIQVYGDLVLGNNTLEGDIIIEQLL